LLIDYFMMVAAYPQRRCAPSPALRGGGLGSYALGLVLDTKNHDVIQAWDEDSP
jgi:hypothetical protein